MKQVKIFLILAACAVCVYSCKDETKNKIVDFPNDVTFNEGEGIDITPPHLGFVIPDAPFTAKAIHDGAITLNVKKNADGTHTGFALSNKNYRSYPWCTAIPRTGDPDDATLRAATDTCIYSVYTSRPSQTRTYTVVRVEGDEAYFTINTPRVVEHILVANNTLNYMLLSYGSTYSSKLNTDTQLYEEYKGVDTLAVVRNPNIPDASEKKFRVWHMPDYYNFSGGEEYLRLEGHKTIYGTTGYVKLIARGYNGSTLTGESEYYIAVRTGGAPAPYDKWNTIQTSWAAWDLSSLGAVDKVVFSMDSSDKDSNGKMRTPPYFCMDGVRLK